MQVTTHTTDGITCVSLAGDLDARSAPVAYAGIVSALPHGQPVLLNLSKVPYVSSAGLRVLLMVHRRAQKSGVHVALMGLSDHLRSALLVTGFLRLFHIAESYSDALALLRQDHTPSTNERRGEDQ